MKTQKLLSLALVLVMVLALFPVTAGAIGVEDYGEFSPEGGPQTAYWKVSENGDSLDDELAEGSALTLTFYGEGELRETKDLDWGNTQPWEDYYRRITRVILEPGITNMPEDLCYSLYNITSIKISATVEKISYNAIHTWTGNPKKLASIEVNENNPNYEAVDGVLITKGETPMLIFYPAGKTDESYTMPDSIEAVDSYVFSRQKYLKSVDWSSGATVVPYSAFEWCSALERVYIPEGVTEIQGAAFMGCTALGYVNLPSTLTKLDSSAFWLITCDESAVEGGQSSFAVDVPQSVTSFESEFDPADAMLGTTGGHIVFNFYGDAPEGIESLENYLLMGTDVQVMCPAEASGWIEASNLECWKEYNGKEDFGWIMFIPYSGEHKDPTLTKAMFTVDTSTVTYTGQPITKKIQANGFSLIEDSDYTVTYENNTEVGTATIKIQGAGIYTGTLEYTFTIKAKSTGGNTSGGSTGGGSSSGGSTGGGSTKPVEPEKPTEPEKPVEPETPAETETPVTPASEKFDDVAKDSWYEAGVTYVTDKGLFQGVGKDTFAPNGTMTRAMIFTVLARLDGQDTSGGDIWYRKGMDWAVAQSISDGSNPQSPMTREQLATMLYRYAKPEEAKGDLSKFTDADAVSEWARPAMEWAVANGIVTGVGGGRLAPQGTATRAQVAAMLMRFCGLTKAE